MVKLPKLSLHDFSHAEMASKEQNALRGGAYLRCACCTNCGCKYAGKKEGPNDSYYGGSTKTTSSSATAIQMADSTTDDL